MITDKYITGEIEPLTPLNTVGDAIEKMGTQHVDLLPVVFNNHLVNYASYDDIEDLEHNTLLSEIEPYATVLPFATLNQHLLNALTHLKTLNVSLMAVLDEHGIYQGVLKTRDVVQAISQSLSIRAGGSIIVLRIKPIDYSLSDLSRIIEYSDAKILGFFIFENEENGDLEVHLKLNTTILKHILATLERYDYNVVQYFNREDLSDDMDERFENLMNYIDN